MEGDRDGRGPGGGESAQGPDFAIKGYDTVACFKLGKAVKGSESFTIRWRDMTWQFSGQEHRDFFAADPEVWKIVDARLYLNCSQAACEKWSRDIPGHIRMADAVWKEKFERE